MNLKTTLLGLVGVLVFASSAQAETPLFNLGRTTGVLGARTNWAAVTFADLSTIGLAKFSFTLLPEQTAAAALQSFSVNNAVVFQGSDTDGATKTFNTPFVLTSFEFNSNVGGPHSVSSVTGNTPTIDHSGEYEIFRSKLAPSTYAFAYEDDFRSNTRFGGDFNDMVVRMTVSAVPEPETYALMLAGLATVVFVLRRRPA